MKQGGSPLREKEQTPNDNEKVDAGDVNELFDGVSPQIVILVVFLSLQCACCTHKS